jgi:glutamate mutase epsilon subunit
VDNENEIDRSTKAIGEEHDEALIDRVLNQLDGDIRRGDVIAIAELLQFVPKEVLNNYLGVR